MLYPLNLQRCFIQRPSLKQQLLGALTLYVDVQNTMASITFAHWVTLMVGADQKGVANFLLHIVIFVATHSIAAMI